MKIYILYTGGTIGSWQTKNGLAPMPWKFFQSAFENSLEGLIKETHKGISLIYDGFDTPLDSTNIQPRQWVEIASKIIDNYLTCDGFLILHGTDTMAYTSSALSFLLPGITKPVIVTGSQLSLFNAKETRRTGKKKYGFLYNTDAVRNILGSIAFLTQGIPEICLYFADTLLRGNRAVKSNANGFTAFESPNFPPLGEYGLTPKLNKHLILPIPTNKKLVTRKMTIAGKSRDVFMWSEESKFVDHIPKIKGELGGIIANIDKFAVVPFLIFPAYYDNSKGESLLVSMLETLMNVKPDVKGVILNSYGSGNVPDFQSMRDFIEYANKRGIVIIDCTQVFSGTVNKNTYATGTWLKDHVISGSDMTPTAALAKLAIQLARTPDETKSILEEKIGEVIAGEMTNNYSLSGHQNEFLMPGDRLVSINGKYQFINTVNGELQIWDISTGVEKLISQKKCGSPGRVVMQSYLGLVFYDRDFKKLYSSPRGGLRADAYLKIEDNGSLTIRNRSTQKVIKVISDEFDSAS